MKVGLVTPYAWDKHGGVNHHIKNLAAYLAGNGHDVRVLAPVSNGHRPDSENVIAVDDHPYRLAAGGSWAYVSVHSLFHGKKIERILEQEKFDILHVHELFMPFLPFMTVGRSNTVNIGTFHAAKDHGNKWYQISRNMPGIRGRMQERMESLDGKICVSPSAKRLISRYFPDYEYTIIPNSVDVDRFSSAEPLEGFNDGRVNILYVGRLEKRKGITYLLQAYGNIAHRSDVRLMIVSSGGNLRHVCDRIIDERGLENVVFANNVSNEELPGYYKTSHLVCAPSVKNESFGIVLLEAMAAGKPVVAFRNPGYEDVVTNGEGVLVPPKDVDGLTQALFDVVDDPESRIRMGEAGRKTVEQYSIPVVGRKIEMVYEEALRRS